jgi:hypothetical protein
MGYKVVIAAVRKEAKKWQGMADDMTPIADAVAALELGPTAFLVISPSALPGFDSIPLAMAYNEMRNSTVDQLRAAGVEFDEIAGALVKCADEYQKAEKISELNFDEIYGS